MYICLPELMYMQHMHQDAWKCKKKASGSLELELQEVVNNPVWGRELVPGSSERAADTLNQQIFFPFHNNF